MYYDSNNDDCKKDDFSEENYVLKKETIESQNDDACEAEDQSIDLREYTLFPYQGKIYTYQEYACNTYTYYFRWKRKNDTGMLSGRNQICIYSRGNI